MVEKDDWRMLNDVDYLENMEINPTDGEDITKYVPNLKKCIFCWNEVRDDRHQFWYIPTDISCCICDNCYYDFKEQF